jgi:hypothetical protein
MRKGVRRLTLVGIVMLADAAMPIQNSPILWEPREKSRALPVATTDVLFLRAGSLANFWRMTCRSLRASFPRCHLDSRKAFRSGSGGRP